jgi:hypothetical protein
MTQTRLVPASLSALPLPPFEASQRRKENLKRDFNADWSEDRAA